MSLIKKLVAVALVIIIVSLVIRHFQIQPLATWLDTLMYSVTHFNLEQTMSTNSAPILGSIGSLVTIIGVAWRKIKQKTQELNLFKTQATNTINEAQGNVSVLASENLKQTELLKAKNDEITNINTQLSTMLQQKEASDKLVADQATQLGNYKTQMDSFNTLFQNNNTETAILKLQQDGKLMVQDGKIVLKETIS